MRDLWKQADAGDTREPVKLDIPPHGVLMLRLTPQ
jgi:hypothetical protein